MSFCCTASSDPLLAVLTVSRWHKCLWHSISTALHRRVESIFPKPNRIFKSFWQPQFTHLIVFLINQTCEMSCTGSQDRGGSWIRSGPMEFSCHMNAWGGELYFRKLLSPPLCSGYAVPQTTEEKVPQQHMCTNAGSVCSYSHPQGKQWGLLIFHGNGPHAGEELKCSTRSSCS